MKCIAALASGHQYDMGQIYGHETIALPLQAREEAIALSITFNLLKRLAV